MGEVLFVGDAHFGHPLVAADRGFASVEQHDATVLASIQRRCRADTTVWWLGDVALGGWRDRIGVIGSIPGVHHLVLGNHDRAFPAHSCAYNYVGLYMEVFRSVQLQAMLSWQGQRLLLSHLPYSGDHDGPDRYSQWRPQDLGVLLIHAHTHSPERVSRSVAGTLQIHAGLDAWGLRPPSISELMVEAGLAG